MNNNLADRSTLKSYFARNKVPTEQNFADLIDAMVNQREDGIAKTQGNPLGMEAQGDGAGPQKILLLYRDFADATPGYEFSLNAFASVGEATSAKPGFTISDGAGSPRMHIQDGTGHVGLGTLTPSAPLHVLGQHMKIEAPAEGQEAGLDMYSGHNSPNQKNWRLAVDGSTGTLGLKQLNDDGSLKQAALMITQNSHVGLGGVVPQVPLHVQGNIMRLQAEANGGSAAEIDLYSGATTTNQKNWNLAADGATGKFLLRQLTDSRGVQRTPIQVNTSGNVGIGGADAGSDTLKVNGTLTVTQGLDVSTGNRSSHINRDGAFYRSSNNVYLAVDNNFYVRDTNTGQNAFHFNTDLGVLTATKVNASVEQSKILNPHIIPGIIVMWTGTTPPSGWALCNGQNGTPDLRGRFVLGYGNGSSLSNRTLKATGGSERVTLNTNELPSHNHSVKDSGHSHTFGADRYREIDRGNDEYRYIPRNYSSGNDWKRSTQSVKANITQSNVGNNYSHENMPPFYVLAYIMKL